MRSQCSVYVDAGYLLAAAATRVTGTSLRSGIHANHAALVAALIAQAEASCTLPVLRVHWYDAAPHGIPDPQQERIGELPRVKLRLGRFGVDGQQKGVDLRIGLDLVAHARNSAAAVCFLVSGDDDLTEAVEEAQVHGVRVVVLAVPNVRGTAHAVSRHLLRAADDLELLDPAAVDAAVVKVEPTPAPPLEPVSAVPASMVPAPTGGPSPALLAGTRRPAPPAASAAVSTTLAWSSSSDAGAGADAEDAGADLAEVGGHIDAVAGNVAGSFLASASTAEVAALLAGRPSIPREIDRALLVDLSSALACWDLSDPERFALRARFWELVDELR